MNDVENVGMSSTDKSASACTEGFCLGQRKKVVRDGDSVREMLSKRRRLQSTVTVSAEATLGASSTARASTAGAAGPGIGLCPSTSSIDYLSLYCWYVIYGDFADVDTYDERFWVQGAASCPAIWALWKLEPSLRWNCAG